MELGSTPTRHDEEGVLGGDGFFGFGVCPYVMVCDGMVYECSCIPRSQFLVICDKFGNSFRDYVMGSVIIFVTHKHKKRHGPVPIFTLVLII